MKDKNTNSPNNIEEFRLSSQSKLFLIGFCIVMVIVFVLIMKQGKKEIDSKIDHIEDNREETDINNTDNETETIDINNNEDDGIISKMPNNINSLINILGSNTQPFDESNQELTYEEKSYLYFNNNVYEWAPDYKVLSDKELNNDYTEANQFGRISSPLKNVSITPEEVSEDHFNIFNSEGYLAIYNPQISSDYISHTEMVDDDIIILVATSFRDFDSHVYIKRESLKDMQQETSIDQYIKNISDNKDLSSYVIKSKIDDRLQERISRPTEVVLSPTNISPISREDIIDFNIRDSNTGGYILHKTRYDNLFKSYYAITTNDNSTIILDIFNNSKAYVLEQDLIN